MNIPVLIPKEQINLFKQYCIENNTSMKIQIAKDLDSFDRKHYNSNVLNLNYNDFIVLTLDDNIYKKIKYVMKKTNMGVESIILSIILNRI